MEQVVVFVEFLLEVVVVVLKLVVRLEVELAELVVAELVK
jgi:hypothetical protein